MADKTKGMVALKPKLAQEVSFYEEIITQRVVRVFHQQIVSLNNENEKSYEILSRSPLSIGEKAALPPFAIFSREYHSDLDRICIENLHERLHERPCTEDNIFINVLIQNIDFFTTFEFSDELKKRVVVEFDLNESLWEISTLFDAVKKIRDMGLRFALDDLKKGKSDVNLIRRIAPDFLKIDISWIQGVSEDVVKQRYVESMVKFCLGIDSKIICEGVEEEKDHLALRDLKVDYIQGFLFSRPVELEKDQNYIDEKLRKIKKIKEVA